MVCTLWRHRAILMMGIPFRYNIVRGIQRRWFDGDTCSANGVYMDNSIKEITDKLKQKEFYISNGKITYANKDDDTSALVLASITQ